MAKVTDVFGMLQIDEGLKLSIYKDTEGYWTVGIGHLLTKKPSSDVAKSVLDSQIGRTTNGTITEAEARKLFQTDVDKAIHQIQLNSTLAPIYAAYDTTRKQALINMVFQMGVNGVAAFKNSLTLVKNGSYSQALTNLRKSKWYSQTPKRAERVIQVLTTGTFDAYN